MLPVLLKVGPITITIIGLMISISFLLASFSIWKKGKEENFDENELMDGVILVSLISFIFSRLSYFLFNPHKLNSFFSLFEFIKTPGYVWAGALIAGIIVLIIFCQKRKWDFFRIGDLSVFGLSMGFILTHLGYFISQVELNRFFFQPHLYYFIFFIFLYIALNLLEKNYRSFEWYKNKRGEANPGFILLSFLLLSTLTNLIIRTIFNSSFSFFNPYFITDLFIIIITIFLFYVRTGKSNLTINFPWFKKRKDNYLKKTNSGPHLKAGMEANK